MRLIHFVINGQARRSHRHATSPLSCLRVRNPHAWLKQTDGRTNGRTGKVRNAAY